MSEIKECPFCGNTDDPVVENGRHFSGPKGKIYTETDYYLECSNCSVTIGYDSDPNEYGDRYCDFTTREEALEFWNKRHKES